MKKAGALLMLGACVFFYGCGCGREEEKKPAEISKIEVKAPLSKSDELRQKAKIAEAASLVGYDGKAIKESLNKFIDNQEIEAKRIEDLKDIH